MLGNDSSLGGGATGFDLHSQAGIMQLLASIRASALTPVEKNELRDLVFLYTNGGGDASVRIALEQKLVAYKVAVVGKAPATSATTASNAAEYPFGTSRPLPVFSTPTATPPPPSTSSPVPPPPPVTAPPPAVPPQNPAPAPATSVPTPPPPQTPPPAPVVPPTPPVVEIPVPPASPVPPAQAPAFDQSRYLDRIREIKALVNQKVGNPVNLVDIDNAVGREYMSALLDAMKKLSGGLVGETETAMQRLEVAYQSVERAIVAHNQGQATPPNVVSPTPMPAQPVASAPAPYGAPPQAETLAPVSSVPVASVPKRTILPPPAWESEMSPTPPPVANVTPAPVQASGFAEVPVATGTSAVATPIAPIPSSTVAPTEQSRPVISSLAEDGKRLMTPSDLPDVPLSEVARTGDPLFTREVDEGLEQLLKEWVLFKKSGLFGTGPRGREHPLFKKLAPLPIPLLLAGRFEGSTQEIKQSITDYMNGWRYEQGIIYDQGETFEHYLRRVIKHIIDLQKKRTGA